MLGSSTLRQWYASADSLSVKPQVICEWNANDFSGLRSFGHSSGNFTSVTDITQVYVYDDPGDGSIQDATETVLKSITTLSGLDNSYRLAFALKATSPIDITVTATAKDSSNRIINSTSMTFTAYASEKRFYYIDAFVKDPTKEIASVDFKAYGYNQSVSSGITVYFTDMEYFTVSKSETSKKRYTSLYDVFTSGRPGEAYLHTSDALNSNVSPYHLAFYNFINTLITGTSSSSTSTVPLSKSRDFIPNFRSAFQYYFYQYQTGNNAHQIFVKYQNTFKANKIVLKFNAVKDKPQVEVSTWNGSAWSAFSSPVATQSNGLLVLYWNGSTWTSTPWASVPTYTAGTTFDGVSIQGVKVRLTSNVVSDVNYNEVHLVEFSPRLELDLSQYIESYSITKELSNDSYPTPVGTPNSNSASITFNNIPEYDGTLPFDQYKASHPFYGLMSKNVKFRLYAQPFGNDYLYDKTPLGVFYSKGWAFNGIESVTVECYDSMRDLALQIAPVLYLENKTPAQIISIILDNCGITDYIYDELFGTNGINTYTPQSVSHFWTLKDKSILDVLKSICLPYQIICYIDEYGIIRFKHLKQIVSSDIISEYMITDTNTIYNLNTVKSNIISINENEENRPANLTIEYTEVSPYSYNEVTTNNPTVKARKLVDIWTPPKEYIGYIEILEPITITSNAIVYKDTPEKSAIDSFSGYLLVDREIIKFDGKEYQFIQSTSTGTNTYVHIVKSQQEVDRLRSYYLLQSDKTVYNVSVVYSIGGKIKLRNLTRGCFGTPIENHGLTLVSYSVYKDVAGTRSSVSDGLVSLEKNKLVLAKDNSIQKEIFILNNSLTKEYRIISGSFTMIPEKDFPKDGKAVEFGLACGLNNTTTKTGVYVGIQMTKVEKTGKPTQYVETLIIRQFGSTTIPNRVIEINNSTDPNSDVIKNPGFLKKYINWGGENTITLYFANDNISESTTYNNVCVILNGNIVPIGNSYGTYISVPYDDSSSYKFPAIKLGEALSLDSKYFGAYSNGRQKVYVNYLQAVGAVGDSGDKQVKNNNLKLLSSIMYGNTYGISNRNELDAVIKGDLINDYIEQKQFYPSLVGREIKVFDIEYSTYPAITKSINLFRNSYSLDAQIIPSESATFSVLDASPVSARFAMINSYIQPVYINGINTTQDTAQSVTFLKGDVLVPSQNGTVTTLLDSTGNDDSSIKIQSDWIQSRIAATSLLDTISGYAIMKRSNLEIELFGNPLISIGDVLNVSYAQRNILNGVYVVTAVRQSFSNGISTNVTLRRIVK